LGLRFAGRLLFFLGWAGIVAVVLAQDTSGNPPVETPRFHINAQAVAIDVVVTKTNGEPSSGLVQREFTVLEDGKSQAIDFFEEHSAPRDEAPAPPKLPPDVFTNRPRAAGDTGTALLIDEMNTALADRHAMFGAAQGFLENLPPRSRVAIFILRSKLQRARGFTTDISGLQAALRGQKASAMPAGTRTGWEDAEDRMTSALFAQSGAQYAGAEGVADIQEADRSERTLAALELLARNLAGTPGRKNLVWFAGSFPVSLFPQGNEGRSGRHQNGSEQGIQKAAGLLAESKIAVYPVSVAGVAASVSSEAATRSEEIHGGDILRADEQQNQVRNENVASMERLASETGGQAVYGTNDLKGAAARAAGDVAHYYTLVYTPSGRRTDARFRRIEVKVDQPNLRLAYRRGYYGGPAAEYVEPTSDPLPPLLLPGSPAATQIVYEAYVQSAPRPADATPAGGNAKLSGPVTRYSLNFTIPPSGLSFENAANGAQVGIIESAIVAWDAEGKKLNWAGGLTNFALNPASFEAAHRSGLLLHLEIDVPSTAATLVTGVYDRGGQRAGTLEIPVEPGVPPATQAGETEMIEPKPAAEAEAPATTPSEKESGPQSQPAQTPDPVLLLRPPAPVPAMSTANREGRMSLDVVVNDATGMPVRGLEPWDFKLLDNDRSSKILSFHSYDGAAVRPDPPVEVILVVDELNLPFTLVAFVRSELAEFLRQNGGHLAQPLSIMLLTEEGLRIQPRPSLDGLAQLDLLSRIQGHISSINTAMGAEGALERAQISVHQMATIAENEAKKPGRKLLIWVGPGWPMLQSQAFRFNEKDQRRYFDVIVELTNRLREARIVVYSVSPEDSSMGGGPSRSLLYKSFLKGVTTEQQADIGNLALKVLVSRTGGRILGPDNDLVGQINQCIAEANAFYRLSFDPPRADHPDEYHDVQVQVNQSGMMVRTNSGYYNEPRGN
jgi:VWFA-related protein